jgi:hypothetical protein
MTLRWQEFRQFIKKVIKKRVAKLFDRHKAFRGQNDKFRGQNDKFGGQNSDVPIGKISISAAINSNCRVISI